MLDQKLLRRFSWVSIVAHFQCLQLTGRYERNNMKMETPVQR